jgi:hypothetical protein
MKILTYSNRKFEPIYYRADTQERELLAYHILFQMLDENWQVYGNATLSTLSKKLYDEAKAGNKESAKRLLRLRRSNEYEEVYEKELFDPLDKINE